MVETSTPTIVADVFEDGSGVPASLRRLGTQVVVKPLPAGDYKIAGGALVERKTVTDLHGSLARGCLLAIADLGIAVVRTQDSGDTALWLHRLALRQQRRERASSPANGRRLPPPGVSALSGIPGIAETIAHALLERFGSVERLLAAGPERWAEGDGVGPVRAHALATALLDGKAQCSRPMQ
jgi:ERCC4-type nuclease